MSATTPNKLYVKYEGTAATVFAIHTFAVRFKKTLPLVRACRSFTLFVFIFSVEIDEGKRFRMDYLRGHPERRSDRGVPPETGVS